jgi:hypothetical protein
MRRPLKQIWQAVLVFLTAAILLWFTPIAGVAEPLTVKLEYHEVDFPIQSLYLRSEAITNATQTFKKLPDGVTANCQYMNLLFGRNKISIAWDPKANQLWVDQNRNLDFSDDPEGRYTPATNQTAFSLSRGNSTPNFPKLRVSLPHTNGISQYCIGLTLGRNYDELKSFYAGRLVIAGKEWQVGWIFNPIDSRNPKGFLLLRPWPERTNLFTAKTWSIETFPLPETLCLEGINYRLDFSSDSNGTPATPVVQFTETSGPTGELTIHGASVERVALLGKGRVVSIGRPFGQTAVPTGIYEQMIVLLKAGNAEAEGYFSEPLTIQPGVTKPLTLGGPLTNLVTLERRDRQLNLSYKLAGAGGKKYHMVRKGTPEPPRFEIYQGDRRLVTGKFEFG